MKLKVLELFGGIGAPRKALENIGFEVESTYVDVDPDKVAGYNAIYNESFEPISVTEFTTNDKYDVLAHGSPCDDFSKNGKRRGGDEGSGTQSSLMWETTRIVEECRPPIVVWENVENVISHENIHNFEKYIQTLNDLGYISSYQVCAGDAHGGLPQRRKRIIVVSTLDTTPFDFRNVEWFDNVSPLEKFVEISSHVVEDFHVEVNKGRGVQFVKTPAIINLAVPTSKSRRGRIIEDGKIVPTLLTSNEVYLIESKHKTRDIKEDVANESKMLLNDTLGIEVDKFNCRKLHPLETYRLMGFDDSDYYKSKRVSALSALEAQAGDSIVVPMLECVFKEIFKDKFQGPHPLKMHHIDPRIMMKLLEVQSNKIKEMRKIKMKDKRELKKVLQDCSSDSKKLVDELRSIDLSDGTLIDCDNALDVLTDVFKSIHYEYVVLDYDNPLLVKVEVSNKVDKVTAMTIDDVIDDILKTIQKEINDSEITDNPKRERHILDYRQR